MIPMMRSDPLTRMLAVFAIAAMVGSAAAASPSFGVTVSPFTGGYPVLTASAMLPVVTMESAEGPVAFAGRLDVSTPLDFSTLPSVGLAVTAAFTGNDMFQPYIGAGASLGWYGSAGTRFALLTPTVLAGLRVPFDVTWAARVEVAAAPLVGGVSLGLGLEVSPW